MLLEYSFVKFSQLYDEILSTLSISEDINPISLCVHTDSGFRSFINKYFSYRQILSLKLAHNVWLMRLLKFYYICQLRIDILKEKVTDLKILESYKYITESVDKLYHLYELLQNVLLDPENKWSFIDEYVYSAPESRTCSMLSQHLTYLVLYENR